MASLIILCTFSFTVSLFLPGIQSLFYATPTTVTVLQGSAEPTQNRCYFIGFAEIHATEHNPLLCLSYIVSSLRYKTLNKNIFTNLIRICMFNNNR